MKIIAIAGGNSTGKSKFSNYLARRIGPSIQLSLSSYYLDKPNHVPIENHNFEIPSAFDFKKFNNALEDLREELPIQLPHYDISLGKRISSTKIVPKEYLIIEGCYTLMHASIRSSLSYSFYIECPPDVMLSRLIQKNGKELNYTYDYSIQQYFAYVRPAYYTYVVPTRQYANMVISNDYNSQLEVFIDDFLSRYQL